MNSSGWYPRAISVRLLFKPWSRDFGLPQVKLLVEMEEFAAGVLEEKLANQREGGRKEIQEKTLEELLADGRNLRQEVFNLRLQQASAQLEKPGRLRTLRRDSGGKPFIGPNDFAADAQGGIYFSASGVYDLKAPITGAVLHLSADGKSLTQVADTIHYSNGLTLTKDQQHLLVAEMLAGRVLDFPIGADGRLGPRSVWARLQDLAPPTPHADAYNGPDGLKLGSDGNYYLAQNGSGRVLVVSGDKTLVRTLEVPTPYVTNVAFGPEGAVFVTGAFEQWKPPYPGAVYRWTP